MTSRRKKPSDSFIHEQSKPASRPTRMPLRWSSSSNHSDAELNARANRVAHYLSPTVVQGTMCCHLHAANTDLVIAMLAC